MRNNHGINLKKSLRSENIDNIIEYAELVQANKGKEYIASQLFNYVLTKVDLANTNFDRLLSVRKSMIDLLVINDEVQVYTINTNVNDIILLERRLQDFQRVFDKINIVTDAKSLPKIEQLQDYRFFGIYLIDAEGNITEIKKAVQHRKSQQYHNMLCFLKIPELENILLKVNQQVTTYQGNGDLQMHHTIINSLTRKQFEKEFALQLYTRKRPERDIIMELPSSLRYILYFGNISKRKFNNLKQKIQLKYQS